MTYSLPRRVVKAVGVTNPRSLLNKKEMQINLNETDYATFNGKGYIILDFGKELAGGIRLLSFMITDEKSSIRVRFGESLTECCAELGERGACNDHSPRDFSHPLPFLSDMTLGATGFRFVRIDHLEDKEWQLKSVYAAHEILNKRALWRYRGEDKLIAKIFDTAKRTVDLCAHRDYVWDGIKRDRLVWIGDMHPEMLSLATIYGRLEVVENSLNMIRCTTPLPGWMNNFPTYSMWWAIIVADYDALTDCRDFTEAQLDYLEGLMAQANAHVTDAGEMQLPMYFVDWPTKDTADELPGSRAIMMMAAKKTIALFEKFGRSTAEAKALLAKLDKVEIKVEKMKQVIALKYFAKGEISDAEYAMLVRGGAHGMSTFMSYYILTAVASRDVALATEMMKEYYGAMLAKGATTFWEDFDLDWCENSSTIDRFPKKGQRDIHGDFGAYCYLGFRHSLCHGWSSAVIRFIKEHC